MSDLFDMLDLSASGMAAQRTRLAVSAGNLANAQTTRTPEGGPYRRRVVLLEAVAPKGASGHFGWALLRAGQRQSEGVRVSGIGLDPTPLTKVRDPGHPDADAQGYVTLPNVEPFAEMVDLMTASRAYEANASAMETTRGLIQRTLDILK